MKPKPRSATTFLMVPVVMRPPHFPNQTCKTHGLFEKGVDHTQHRHGLRRASTIAQTFESGESSPGSALQLIDESVRALHVVELGRRADLVRGQLGELPGREVAPARVAEDDVDAAIACPSQPRA